MTERLELSLERLADIPKETLVPEPFRDFFCSTADFLLLALKGREADNHALYADILPDHYDRSYGNPSYAAERLGQRYGILLSAVYAELRGIIPCVFEGDEENVTILLELFLELYFAFSDEEVPSEETVRSIFASYVKDYLYDRTRQRIGQSLDTSHNFAADIIEKADGSGTAYLYDFGEYISESALKTAAYLNSLPGETITDMARTAVEGFCTGFEKAGKDLSAKKTVQIRFCLGFERMVRACLSLFKEKGLSCLLTRAAYFLSEKRDVRRIGWYGDIPNRQFDYDHRNDIGLVLDKDYVSMRLRDIRECYEERKEAAGLYAGPLWIDTFGEELFVPKTALTADLSSEKERLLSGMRNDISQITKRYIPAEETGFAIIAYPLPDIGPDFEAIFRETVRINTLSSKEYEVIQQKLIDALDRGYGAHITGREGNRTDLTVIFHALSDRKKETAFENCTADVNIPVGEVFTSPRLKGTNGLLHVKNACLNGLTYHDLTFSFRDGMTDSYTCRNYESEEENRRLIEESILCRHKSLPMGEFAIGTNTRAYRMGQRFGIQEKLPILIAEKTGPHFALGDTCYSFEEDYAVYNPDGKEIIARDNEVSLQRKTDPAKAYFGCHTDITLPYDELGLIEVLVEEGENIPLLKNGRFVLEGCEVLNGPLDER